MYKKRNLKKNDLKKKEIKINLIKCKNYFLKTKLNEWMDD